MSEDHGELLRRLSALSERFLNLSARLGDAGAALAERRTLPPESLDDEIAAVHAEFLDLCETAAAMAASLQVSPPGGNGIAGLRDLALVVKAILETPAQEASSKPAADDTKRRRAEEEAQRRAAEQERRKAEEESRRKDEEQARRKAEEEARRKAEEEARRKAEDEARRAAEAQARKKAEDEARRRAEDEARRNAEEEARRKAEEEQEPAAEEPGDALDLDTARWWISASASLTSIRSRRLSFDEAVKQELAKYSYVFSVPIQRSADYEDGLLAYGYAVLLEHLEEGMTGFVADALGRLPPAKGVPLGQRLFRYLAEQGRLRERYPEFIKAVMLAAVPEPGLWTEAGISETRAATTITRRATATLGEHAVKQQALSQDAQRFVGHRFPTVIAPLTSKFFRVDAGELRDARDLLVSLTEGGGPSDSGWLVTVRSGRGGASQAMRLDRGGASVPAVGRDYSAVWVGVFNADPATEKRFELTVVLKRQGPTASKAPVRPR